MQVFRKVHIPFLVIVFCLMSYSLAVADFISKTGGYFNTPVYIDNPGSHTSTVTVSGIPSGAKITNVKVVYAYHHCPYDRLKVTLSKSKADVQPIEIMDDWTPAYVTPNYTYNDSKYFENANPNDSWSITMAISSNGCPNANCNPAYHGHEGYFYEWTITITYDPPPPVVDPPAPTVPPVTAAPPLTTPNRFFTGTTSGSYVNLTWGTVPGAERFKLEISPRSNFDWNTYYIKTSYLGWPWLQTDAPLSGQLGVFHWRVQAYNSNSIGPFSETRKFFNGPSMECFPEIVLSNRLFNTCYDFGSKNYLLKDITTRKKLSGIKNVIGEGGEMQDTASITTEAYGIAGPMQDSDNVWNDPTHLSAIDAHVNSSIVYAHILKTFLLPSPAGDGRSMINIVEETKYADGSPCSNRAYYSWYNSSQTSDSTVRYCVGLPPPNIDVVAHEWAHAVSSRASLIRGYNQPIGTFGEGAALEEAFADCMAIFVKQRSQGGGSWMLDFGQGQAKHDFVNPLNSSPPQAAFYGGKNWSYTMPGSVCTPTPDNNECGTYINAGVFNKMFYILSEGGEGVQPIGIDKAIQIVYKSSREKWKRSTPRSDFTFREARQGMIIAAEDLYPGSTEAEQVNKAWAAVGVTSTTTPQALWFRLTLPALMSGILLF